MLLGRPTLLMKIRFCSLTLTIVMDFCLLFRWCRYVMWLKVFGAWKDFVILQTVKKAKVDRATNQCKCWTCSQSVCLYNHQALYLSMCMFPSVYLCASVYYECVEVAVIIQLEDCTVKSSLHLNTALITVTVLLCLTKPLFLINKNQLKAPFLLEVD